MRGEENVLETLRQYRDRTAFMWDSLPQRGGLRTSDGLALKVNPDGSFRPFYGDTVIFMLPQPMIAWLARIQAELYAACGAHLAQRIAPKTFHITLHDLLNQAQYEPLGLARNRQQAMLAIEEVCRQDPPTIVIRSNCLFSMVSTSIVMGFEPATKSDCAALMEMYEHFQHIVPLSYPLTLHATLAYYKPGEYDEGMLLQLRKAMQCIGREQKEWRLDLQELRYATFQSMTAYCY